MREDRPQIGEERVKILRIFSVKFFVARVDVGGRSGCPLRERHGIHGNFDLSVRPGAYARLGVRGDVRRNGGAIFGAENLAGDTVSVLVIRRVEQRRIKRGPAEIGGAPESM